jgi:hypothetical protein
MLALATTALFSMLLCVSAVCKYQEHQEHSYK